MKVYIQLVGCARVSQIRGEGYSFLRTVITKRHRRNGLKNRNLFFSSSGGYRSEIKHILSVLLLLKGLEKDPPQASLLASNSSWLVVSPTLNLHMLFLLYFQIISLHFCSVCVSAFPCSVRTPVMLGYSLSQ